nr:hypothetical protein BaRGS_013198 [Batillaria attramentaria]
MEDLTRKAGAAGPQVVDAVVSLIRESCDFPNDRLLLRRFAYIETNDGQNPDTYRLGFDGGIWAVNETTFRGTQNVASLQPYYTQISSRFGINWNTNFGDNVPVGIEKQAAWYQKNVHPDDRMAAYNFTKTAERLENACNSANLDLAFLMDSSSSMSPIDFDLALQFAADIVGTFNIAPDAVRVAFLTFSTGFRTEFNFNAYTDAAAVQNAIKNVQYISGETDTAEALEYAASTLFSPASGARSGSAKVAVLVTDGRSSRPADTVAHSKDLQDQGVTVFAIGVGDAVDKDELNSVASAPSCTHVQGAKDYQDLETIRAEIQQLACRVWVRPVAIRPNNGYVSVYASFLNPNPSAAFNEVNLRATASQEGMIYVKDSNRPLYLSVVSQGVDPVLCNSGQFDLIVQNKNAINPTLGVPNPCRPNHPGFYKFPNSYDRFIYCDSQGNYYLVYCPIGYWAWRVVLDAGFLRIPSSPPPNPITQNPGTYNPCTQAALDQGLRFFPYPPDETKYIACTEWPGYGVVHDCEPYHRWEQKDLACIYIDTVVNPTKNLYLTSPEPLDFNCTPGMNDGAMFYHAHPTDRTKFIQCDQFGNAFVLSCKPQMVWNQRQLNCIPNGLLPDQFANPVG